MTDLNKIVQSGRVRKEEVNFVRVEFLPGMPDFLKAPLSEIENWVGKLPLDEEMKTNLLDAISKEREASKKEET